ncbi:MAG: hypothetical protein D6788_00815 [Planctomycetota bacterium]|nr:MAG: hypothetical protein D6788_00815 [Planctomycetota bacterium]
MTVPSPQTDEPITLDPEIEDHVSEARRRAETMLGGETHLGAVDDWRTALVSGRDALILVWGAAAALYGFGWPAHAGAFLVILSVAVALLRGISTGRSTFAQAQYYASELERERQEIREHFDHEVEEVRALYAAKGFREPLLGQIVETLTSDDDRLLKVMMEEELGLRMYHMNHPLVVGLWNFSASLVCGLVPALSAYLFSPETTPVGLAVATGAMLAVVSVLAALATRRNALEFFTVGGLTALIVGGAAYYLARWLALSAGGVDA